MTANISQSVVPRRRQIYSCVPALTTEGTWHGRPLRSNKAARPSFKNIWQRGSVTQSTMTITFSLLMLGAVSLLGFFYLQQVFDTASQDTEIQHLQTQLSDLHDKQRQLELEGAEARSIQKVEDRVQQLNMQHVDTVSYLAPQTDQLAVAH